MQRAIRLSGLGNWLVFLLMAASFCIFAFFVPNLYCRYHYFLNEGLILGAIAGQFSWSVAWCALGPGRWLFRYVAVVALGIVIAGALSTGIESKPETEMERREAQRDRAAGQEFSRSERVRRNVWQATLALPLSLLVCQLPMAWNRSYRGWRIVFRGTDSPSSEAELLKFGLSELLAAAAGAAIALGFWRFNMSETSKGFYGPQDALVATFFCVFLSLIAGSFLLPVTSLILGDRPADVALAANFICIIGLAMALVVAAMVLHWPARTIDLTPRLFVYLCGIFTSMSTVFWVARACGYQLVRGRPRGMVERSHRSPT